MELVTIYDRDGWYVVSVSLRHLSTVLTFTGIQKSNLGIREAILNGS